MTETTLVKNQRTSLAITSRRSLATAGLRIAFGVVWAIDAWFKWQPNFLHQFETYLTGAADGQPAVVQAWVNFWINIAGVNPHFFGYATAIIETLIAVALILGAFTNLTAIIGALFSTVIWSTAEGFGGPYVPGSVDIGSAIIYVLVFAALALLAAGRQVGLDAWIAPRLGKLSWLAS